MRHFLSDMFAALSLSYQIFTALDDMQSALSFGNPLASDGEFILLTGFLILYCADAGCALCRCSLAEHSVGAYALYGHLFRAIPLTLSVCGQCGDASFDYEVADSLVGRTGP